METSIENTNSSKMVKAMYILNFVGILLPFCALVAAVLAYVFREDSRGYLTSHFQYLIRTFWISLLYYLVSGLLCIVLVGYFLLFLSLVWWIIRNAKGLRLVLAERPILNTQTWGF